MALLDALKLGPGGLGGHGKVPVILQTEAAECGLACLAMVASAHGHRTDLPALRRRFSVSLKGATLVDLVRMADELQLLSRALRAELDELPQLQTPCVLHWDLNHFVVLVAVRRGVAIIHDPARGNAGSSSTRSRATSRAWRSSCSRRPASHRPVTASPSAWPGCSGR